MLALCAARVARGALCRLRRRARTLGMASEHARACTVRGVALHVALCAGFFGRA